MKTKCIILLLVVFPHLAFAQSMHDTFFISGLIGSGFPGESENVPSSAKGDQTPTGGTAFSFNGGYKWEHFSLEMVFTNFGDNENSISSKYVEEHSAYFIGAGLHWTWSWFDLKLGWGTGNDKVKYTKDEGATTFSASPNGKNSSGSGGYFGLGVNFDLGERTEFIIDYTGYAWAPGEEQTITVDGDSKTSDDSKTTMAVIGIGLRRFF